MKFIFNILLTAAVIIFVTRSNELQAQEVDFQNYSALKSQGKIPKVFTQTSDEKVIEASRKTREKMDEAQKSEFLEYIHYGIDELLHSGLIVYGDLTSKYVDKVAKKLLENQPKLKKELQFYVIKSNVTNALSTDQGVIFVTLGLLSQLENEAQLACVLAHEIAHFQESHVEKSYTNRTSTDKNTSYDQRIELLSNHSKDQELEADKKGIELYNKAGYSKNELLSAFDVMMYSYLPFDEEPLPVDYFNNQYLNVPVSLFPETINKIQVDEDYDDSKSSHPNIRKRKDAVKEALVDFPNWGDATFLLNENEFNTVRKIARFESLRLDVLYSHFGDALYSVFLLEKEFPNNLYINRLKAQAWLGMTAYKESGNFSNTLTKPSKVEGESHAMHYFLYNLSKIELFTISLRMIQDAEYLFPEDDEINEIYKRMIKYTVDYSKFNISDYSELNLEQAIESFEKSKIELENKTAQSDTLVVEGDKEELSKYDKIKIKRDSKVASDIDEEFDSEKYYIYALSDIKKNESFAVLNRQYKEEKEDRKKKEDAYYAMTKKERAASDALDKKKAVKEVVLLDPSFEMTNHGVENQKESRVLELKVVESIKTEGKKYDIAVYDVTNGNLEELNTEGFNERALLNDFIRQKAEYDDVLMFPVDYTALKEVKNQYGDVDLLFTFGEHKRKMHYSKAAIVFSVLLPPYGLVYGIAKLITGNHYSFNAVLVNLSTSEVRTIDTFFAKQKPNTAVINGSVYQLMSKLKGSKK